MADIYSNPYVKFLKGSPGAYASLETKDENTLYFITVPGASVGKLYLGEILVAGNVSPDGTNIVDSLAELIDVDLKGLSSGQVLSYDGESGKWVPITLPEAVTTAIMIGADANNDGAAGLVPAPKAGDENKFLRGDGTWAEVTGGTTDLTNYVTKDELNTTNNNVQTNADAIDDLKEDYSSLQNSMTWGSL